tara:strand:- start:123 stop:305 length:183 start_codon:yes stop_codon:yes gene_type:complete
MKAMKKKIISKYTYMSIGNGEWGMGNGNKKYHQNSRANWNVGKIGRTPDLLVFCNDHTST